MRIPTFNMFQQQTLIINNQYQLISDLYAKASSHLKLARSSEDPVLASQIQSTYEGIQDLSTYNESGINAQNRTSLYESCIQSGIDSVSRIKELISRAQNDTLTDQDRVAIGNEMQGYLSTLLNISNTKDNGQYIFGGFNTTVEPYIEQAGGFVYQGGYTPSTVDIGPNANTIFNEAGYNVFGNIYQGNGTFTVSFNPAINTGTSYTTEGAVNSANYIPDTYTVTFVTNGAGNLGYQVVGAVSGQVVPTPPQTTPAQAPDFHSGTPITFNGVSLDFLGAPAVGDQFTVQPSQTQDVFTTLQGLIDILQTPTDNNPQQLAYFHQGLVRAGASFDQVADAFISYQAELGSRMLTINNEVNANKNLIDDQNIVLGKLAGANLPEVISTLQLQLTSLEATQMSFMKIQQTLLSMIKS